MAGIIKNRELIGYLNSLSGFNDESGTIVCKGFKNELVTLGTKVRLNKIEKELIKHYQEFEEAKKLKIKEVYPDGITREIEEEEIKTNSEQYTKLITELTECGEDTVTLEFEKIQLSKVEDLVTLFDYSYLLELISE